MGQISVEIPPESGSVLSATQQYDIKLGRALTLAKDVEVTVRSWDSKTKKALSYTAKASGVKSPSPGVPTRKGGVSTTQYVFTRPNLTTQQAIDLAQKKLKEISQHERTVSFSTAGDTVLTPRQTVRVAGTGTDADMDYYIHEITRTISADGFTQAVGAKNAPPKNDSLVIG